MTQRWILGFAVAACLAASAPAEAEPVQPDGLPATPGQYTGYQDWLTKQRFTKRGMPDEVVNTYVQCAYQALHDLMTPIERDMLDQAARGNGMTAKELRAFERAVADRFGAGEVSAQIVTACQEPYDRFLEHKPVAED
jgi:hypothetical protein